MEWYELELAPRARLDSAPHTPGTVEHLTAWTDGLEVTSGAVREALPKGATARYHADVPHSVVNEGDVPARALMVVLYT
jgi:hypothetical protein